MNHCNDYPLAHKNIQYQIIERWFLFSFTRFIMLYAFLCSHIMRIQWWHEIHVSITTSYSYPWSNFRNKQQMILRLQIVPWEKFKFLTSYVNYKKYARKTLKNYEWYSTEWVLSTRRCLFLFHVPFFGFIIYKQNIHGNAHCVWTWNGWQSIFSWIWMCYSRYKWVKYKMILV